MGVEKTDLFFYNLHIYSKLQKYNNLLIMPLCAIVFRYVPINYKLVTNDLKNLLYYLIESAKYLSNIKLPYVYQSLSLAFSYFQTSDRNSDTNFCPTVFKDLHFAAFLSENRVGELWRLRYVFCDVLNIFSMFSLNTPLTII